MIKLSEKPLGALDRIAGVDAMGNIRLQPIVATAVSVASLPLPADLAWFQTAGYHSPGDGGAAVYVRSNAIAHLRSADGGSWKVASDVANVRMFGARGDGSDDTAAIEAAHAHAVASSSAAGVLPPGLLGSTAAALHFPAGHYVYRGEGLAQDGGNVVVTGSPGGTVIDIASDVYFLSASGIIWNTYVAHLGVRGGKGAFRFGNTKQNVAGMQVFENCRFIDYSECAIGNNSSDHPYLKVRNCMFFGHKNGGTIGIAWGGNLDSLSIEDCSFMLNRYHLKLGPRLSGSINIDKNDFISFRKGVRAADIWILPAPTEVNAGTGFIIDRNKFGNENLLPDESRILIAKEDPESGPDRLSRHHSEEWVGGSPTVRGLSISRNRIDGISGMSSAFIRSYVDNVDAVECTDNYFGGGIHRMLCEFMAPAEIETTPRRAPPRWVVSLNAFSQPFTRAIANRPVGLTLDPFTVMPGIPSLFQPGPERSDRVDLLRPGSAMRLLAVKPDPSNSLTFASGAPAGTKLIEGMAYVTLDKVTSDRTSWVTLAVRSASDDSVRLTLEIMNPSRKARALLRTFLAAGAESFSVPFVFPFDGGGWQLTLTIRPKPDGTRPPVAIDRLLVYHASQVAG